jgi:hypothetical protein
MINRRQRWAAAASQRRAPSQSREHDRIAWKLAMSCGRAWAHQQQDQAAGTDHHAASLG